MSNEEIQRQANLAQIEEVEKELTKSAKIRKMKEQVRKANMKINKENIERRYIEKHCNMNKDELLSNLKIVEEIVNLINN